MASAGEVDWASGPIRDAPKLVGYVFSSSFLIGSRGMGSSSDGSDELKVLEQIQFCYWTVARRNYTFFFLENIFCVILLKERETDPFLMAYPSHQSVSTKH